MARPLRLAQTGGESLAMAIISAPPNFYFPVAHPLPEHHPLKVVLGAHH